MRPTAILDVSVTGDLGGSERIGMEIDAAATKHIINLLTDLYSNRIGAFVREYATNAWDAHIMAGTTDQPIRVTLPTTMSPFYRVKDFGIGLDIEDIRNVYSKYGASLKRQSDDFNGMLGLGCKSALTYTGQFSITSIKDGMKYEVSISRIENGTGEIEIVDTYATNEPNGVEIVIPIKRDDVYTVATEAKNFFRFWKPGMVLINNQQPEFLEMRKVADKLFTCDNLDKDCIVMGHVAYPIPGDGNIFEAEPTRWGRASKEFGVIYFADMGEVTFTPSREGLQTTKDTMNTVEKAKKDFMEYFQQSLQAEIDAVGTKFEAFLKSYKIRKRYSTVAFINAFTYKGEVIPQVFTAPERDGLVFDHKTRTSVPGKVKGHWSAYDARGGSSDYSMADIEPRMLLDYSDNVAGHFVFVVNSPQAKPSVHQRSKMRRAYSDGLFPGKTFIAVMVEDVPGDGWLDEVPTMDWSVIRDLKMNTTVKAKSSIETFPVLNEYGSMSDKVVDKSKPIAFISPTEWRDTSGWRLKNYYLCFNRAGITVIELGANRHNKFKRENPASMDIYEGAKKVYSDYINGLSDLDKLLISAHGIDVALAEILRPHALDIDDAGVVDFINNVNTADREAAKRLHDAMDSLARSFGVKTEELEYESPFKEYPLVLSNNLDIVRSNVTHTISYFNLVHNS